MTTYRFVCRNCGREFEADTPTLKRFCSRECWVEGRTAEYGEWPKPSTRQGFGIAFRNAVSDHVQAAKARIRIEDRKRICYWCGFPVGDDGEFHHVRPFADLIEEFLEEHGLSRDDIEIDAPEDRRKATFRLADPEVRHAWQNYHQKHGELVPVHSGHCHRMADATVARSDRKGRQG